MNTELIKDIIQDAGGTKAVAIDRGINESAVYNWIARGQIPADHCPSLERLSGGKRRCEQMRSDVEWSVLRGSSVAPISSSAASSNP
ncbi:helix-turn-helix domain-containing protein [Chromobacterium haemolyticum]|uniref:Helix-turn-helix domain-containing protein n=1 Tax=Chromobacterium fluminis TaxID=3044269 RepID=A0ABX0LC86_9NEIS|nr:YdaS family helix-turn-helix protein [Chromobacterium haemolyticum]NHR08390.1 helix-turn-helix domain-containing protein [Chromobacterium haemolyticum]